MLLSTLVPVLDGKQRRVVCLQYAHRSVFLFIQPTYRTPHQRHHFSWPMNMDGKVALKVHRTVRHATIRTDANRCLAYLTGTLPLPNASYLLGKHDEPVIPPRPLSFSCTTTCIRTSMIDWPDHYCGCVFLSMTGSYSVRESEQGKIGTQALSRLLSSMTSRYSADLSQQNLLFAVKV